MDYYYKQCKCGAWCEVKVINNEVVEVEFLDDLPKKTDNQEVIYRNDGADKLESCPLCNKEEKYE